MTSPIFTTKIASPTPPLSELATVSVSLETYRDLVKICATRRLNCPIANGSALHARILITKLFEVAEKEVVIVSGSLRDKTASGVDVYGYPPVISAAKSFLADPGTQLNIVLQHGVLDCGDKNRMLTALVNDPERLGTITLTIPTLGVLDSSVPHFMIADGSAYRMETGADAAPGVERLTAVANFGDDKTSADLRTFFDEVSEFLATLLPPAAKNVFEPGVRIQ
jgi:hypothetical protein